MKLLFFVVGLLLGAIVAQYSMSFTPKIEPLVAFCFNDERGDVVKVEALNATQFIRLTDGATGATPESLTEVKKTIEDSMDYSIVDCPIE